MSASLPHFPEPPPSPRPPRLSFQCTRPAAPPPPIPPSRTTPLSFSPQQHRPPQQQQNTRPPLPHRRIIPYPSRTPPGLKPRLPVLAQVATRYPFPPSSPPPPSPCPPGGTGAAAAQGYRPLRPSRLRHSLSPGGELHANVREDAGYGGSEDGDRDEDGDEGCMCDEDGGGVCYCRTGCICGHCLAEEWGEDVRSLSSDSSLSGSGSDEDGCEVAGDGDGSEVDESDAHESDMDGCAGQDLMGVLSEAEREAVQAAAEREILQAEAEAEEAEWGLIEREEARDNSDSD